MVWDVEMLIVCETVCLLSGLPQEGYDPSVHLPAPVQVSRDRSSNRGRELRHLTCAFRVGDIVDIKANGAVQKG